MNTLVSKELKVWQGKIEKHAHDAGLDFYPVIFEVLDWNQNAYRHLTTDKELVIVPSATHLFEEPGALEAVARHACRWFVRYLSPGAVRSGAAAQAHP